MVYPSVMSHGGSTFDTRSLMERVYEYLRKQIHQGELVAGLPVDVAGISRRLGISKTPLRDALIRMETEGFVTIRPRRGVFVNPVTLEDVRQYYQIIGSLESTALLESFPHMRNSHFRTLRKLMQSMHAAINEGKFDSFYRCNLDFHNVYLSLCGNPRLMHMVDMQKRRLYDFPRQPRWIPEWEKRSQGEHLRILELLEAGHAGECAAFIRNVHWSFSVQEDFIRQYYPVPEETAESR